MKRDFETLKNNEFPWIFLKIPGADVKVWASALRWTLQSWARTGTFQEKFKYVVKKACLANVYEKSYAFMWMG